MADLKKRLDAARAEVAKLERQAAAATCAEVGHRWVSLGGCNCGCDPDACCSVPVHECAVCRDCDYGENEWAERQRQECLHREEFVARRALSDQTEPGEPSPVDNGDSVE